MIVGRLMVGAGEGSKEGRMQVTGFSNAKNNFVRKVCSGRAEVRRWHSYGGLERMEG